MSSRDPKLLELGRKRYAHPLTSAMVRVIVPPGHAGVYLLLRERAPLYVGRSDTCTQGRLASHPLLGCATHFVWQPCRDPSHAYHSEAFWYHALSEVTPALRNQCHPARPRGAVQTCPFCGDQDLDAIQYALQSATAKVGAVPRSVGNS